EQGEKIAIVGENGAGKSTLIKLLCGFYNPSKGRILINDSDLKDLNVDSFRKGIAVVFQNYGRYAFTLEQNIALGNITKADNSVQILHASREAGVDRFVHSLKDGIKTKLGRNWGGSELSGGQWQKVAMARTFFKDADLLILDEPTSALDIRSEYKLYRSFSKLTKGKTTILISHRFNTVRMADRIIVLKGGSIIESGTHEQLLNKNGEYAEMYQKQSSGYVKEDEMNG